jgi:SNF2 family DNA or RNA helicase
MSGTPSPQGVIDLWAQMFLVDYGERLGPSYYRFRNLAYLQVMRGAFATFEEKEGVADAVAGLIADVTIRNRREDCLDLPPNQVVHRRTTLAPKHMAKYIELKKRAIVELETGDVSAINAAALLTKLLQVSSGAVYDENGMYHVVDTARYELIADIVEERPHTVVFFTWSHQKEQLEGEFKKRGLSYGLIDGSVSAGRRTEYISQFQAGGLRVMLCQVQSAAHGITLTRGTTTIFASLTYNAELFEQAKSRIYRGGQTQSTETILITADGTAENELYSRLMSKTFNMNNLLEMLR